MKKIYNCKTGKLTESINTPKSTVAHKLYEQRNPSDINDVIENAREIHTTNELGRYLKNSRGPVVFWEYTGNGVAADIVEVYENNDISVCRVDARNLCNSSVEDFYHGENVVIVSSLTRCTSYDAVEITEDIDSLANQSVKVIYVCSLDSANANEICDLLSDADHLVYSPQYDRANYYDDLDDDYANESVTERFAKNRKLYEGSDDEADSDEGSDDEADSDEGSDDNTEDTAEDTGANDDSTSEEGEETEDVPMTAIILTVAKDDADKCKDEMVEAGIPEDGIEILDDDDDDNAKVKVDADYAFELKDYLAGKGIDLEEKIGGEIVGDEEDSDKEEDSTDEIPADDENKGDDSEDAGDFDAEFGDLFGDVEESK